MSKKSLVLGIGSTIMLILAPLAIPLTVSAASNVITGNHAVRLIVRTHTTEPDGVVISTCTQQYVMAPRSSGSSEDATREATEWASTHPEDATSAVSIPCADLTTSERLNLAYWSVKQQLS